MGAYGKAKNQDDERRVRDHDPKKAFEDISLDAIPTKTAIIRYLVLHGFPSKLQATFA